MEKQNNLNLDDGSIYYKRSFNIQEYPECDNCGKGISMFGKYIKREGKYLYVHDSYDPITKSCE